MSQYLIERGGKVETGCIYSASRVREAVKLAKQLVPGRPARQLKVVSFVVIDNGRRRVISAEGGR